MKPKLYWLALTVIIIAVGLLTANCAWIMHGSKQRVSITSAPEQAKVEIKTTGGVSVFTGTTPASAKLKRKREYNVEVSLEGYKTQTLMIDKDIDSWVFGNILCGGVIGLIVDATSGAMYTLDPEMIHVELIQASVDDGEAGIYAVFRVTNSEGDLQTVIVPMIKG